MKIHSLFNTIWPMHCLLCDLFSDNNKRICSACHQTLPFYLSGCVQCGLPVNNSHTHCGSCIANPPPFDHTVTLFHYESPISELITRYKFQGDLSIAGLFATEWIAYLEKNEIDLPELIMPVPLHHKRLTERGFNQALLIAKPIGKHFAIPIDTRTCVRLKNTAAQSHLPAAKRMVNVKNAFALSHAVAAKHVAIVDDVMTTASTVREISQLLKCAGVEKVDVYCCARAGK